MNPTYRQLVVIMDGDFTWTNGVPSSIRNYYAIFGRRYTEVFQRVRILCRVHEVEEPTALPIGGPGVEVTALPPLHGPIDLIKYGINVLATLFKIPRDAAVILRVPGIYPMVAWPILMLRRIPYGVEVMADAAAQFAPGAYRKSFRRFYRFIWVQSLKYQCRFAEASSYVTARSLQDSYPPGGGRPTFSYTTLDLPERNLVPEPRDVASFRKSQLTLINVAMMQKHLKGQDIIIQAVAKLKNRGISAQLWLVGDGDTRKVFEELVRQLDISDEVRFIGRVRAGSEIFALLDQADIFVLPSRQEGLPRVVIEAMARALPCFASDLPGNRELLEDKFRLPIEDPDAWAERLASAISRPEILADASAINRSIARRYIVTNMQPIRNSFYKTLAEASHKEPRSNAGLRV